ncbi:MAG: hypothetical protein P0Y49_10405 [Candidatus Pedobacter colombiensis]|uniref:Uncharacterized protein n=1 Tax=Candidatus Pedobacter colombiensis TaxID=3121371 RepID=A0AAJ5WA01_9SPHI|nr:hypothetical protein [Pedobacter sp.]WEK21548.1 MAG: hypothetical protein P0Y49_10405 [Pedobacter sp.]
MSKSYFLACLKIKDAIIMATESPESPGKEINKNSRPETAHNAIINRKPCKKVSILNAAISANRTNVIARIFINICKYAYSMLS